MASTSELAAGKLRAEGMAVTVADNIITIMYKPNEYIQTAAEAERTLKDIGYTGTRKYQKGE
jgi:hypothetical protein